MKSNRWEPLSNLKSRPTTAAWTRQRRPFTGCSQLGLNTVEHRSYLEMLLGISP